jgi:hypothetical protein
VSAPLHVSLQTDNFLTNAESAAWRDPAACRAAKASNRGQLRPQMNTGQQIVPFPESPLSLITIWDT